MADIRKRSGAKGTTYQVRYPSKATKSGYAYASFDTRKEALAFREDARARDRATAHCKTDIRTVSQGLDQWLKICEKEGRNGREPVTRYTLKNYKYRAGIIKSYPWAKELHELTKPDIIDFRSWLLENHSRYLANKSLTSLHSMIKELISRGILRHDIAEGVTVSITSRYDTPVSIPTEQEIHDLLSASDRLANSKNAQIQRTWEKYRPMLYLAVDSGMRPQEYLALAEYGVKDTGVEVDRAIEGGGTEITVTKTQAGRRFIDLSSHTLDMIRHYVEHHTVENDYNLVFPSRNGRWQNVKNWRRRGFNRACEEAGLMVDDKSKYKPYDLRHFYASMLIDQRVNLKRIQSLMGHRNIQTTLNVYGHLIERIEAQAQERTSVLTVMNRN